MLYRLPLLLLHEYSSRQFGASSVSDNAAFFTKGPCEACSMWRWPEAQVERSSACFLGAGDMATGMRTIGCSEIVLMAALVAVPPGEEEEAEEEE
jgi:hypothetical protein